ncbi:ribulose-phosphate 3-epimerase [Candidatus Hepatobacter penaei]|uniref:ribulose-phosphate 3-epimerase n=1 Tax=Candidatus Hepatobacter penaei TaxID=1274402 RepID=UPI0004F3276E|nr:ribulose-phosphate 3-epimerase [Candidatus Hepatobacter penaei]
MNKRVCLVAPSLLAANPLHLAQALDDCTRADADRVHLDVMDGHFVPNLALNPATVRSICAYSSLKTDVHIMAKPYEPVLRLFLDIPCTSLTVHIEAMASHNHLTTQVKAAGKELGMAINPHTPLTDLDPWLDNLDHVVLMGVEPGFGGQPFQQAQLDRLRALHAKKKNRSFLIHVDGGVTSDLAPILKEAGAEVLVAGTSFFNQQSPLENMKDLRV